MAKLTVSEAARKAGVSRAHLYKRYIDPGKISVQKDNDGKPWIETSELLRVFGQLVGDSEDKEQKSVSKAVNKKSEQLRQEAEDSALVRQLQDEVRFLRAQLEKERDRFDQLLQRVNMPAMPAPQAAPVSVPEPGPSPTPPPGTLENPLQLQSAPQAEPKRRGFFARLFGGGQ